MTLEAQSSIGKAQCMFTSISKQGTISVSSQRPNSSQMFAMNIQTHWDQQLMALPAEHLLTGLQVQKQVPQQVHSQSTSAATDANMNDQDLGLTEFERLVCMSSVSCLNLDKPKSDFIKPNCLKLKSSYVMDNFFKKQSELGIADQPTKLKAYGDAYASFEEHVGLLQDGKVPKALRHKDSLQYMQSSAESSKLSDENARLVQVQSRGRRDFNIMLTKNLNWFTAERAKLQPEIIISEILATTYALDHP